MNPDLVELARKYDGSEIERDLLSIRWHDGAIIVWTGPPTDADRMVVRVIPPPAPWGSK